MAQPRSGAGFERLLQAMGDLLDMLALDQLLPRLANHLSIARRPVQADAGQHSAITHPMQTARDTSL